MPKRHRVCPAAELPPGGRRIFTEGSLSIGVFNVNGEFFALRNVCPHQLAPLCLGKITGTCAPGSVGEYRWERDGEIIRCPWHGWEFDIKTGRSVFNPHRVRVKRYEVTLEPGEPPPEDSSVETFPVTVEESWVVVEA